VLDACLRERQQVKQTNSRDTSLKNKTGKDKVGGKIVTVFTKVTEEERGNAGSYT